MTGHGARCLEVAPSIEVHYVGQTRFTEVSGVKESGGDNLHENDLVAEGLQDAALIPPHPLGGRREKAREVSGTALCLKTSRMGKANLCVPGVWRKGGRMF